MQVGEHVVDQKKLYTGLFIIGTSPPEPVNMVSDLSFAGLAQVSRCFGSPLRCLLSSGSLARRRC
jgi:hypothetical protein